MADAARITVLAGVNGAGKSSVAGASLRTLGGDYFNPDEVSRRLRQASPGMSVPEANAAAWAVGRARLEEAIASRQDFVLETTLGGTSIARLLHRALDEGLEVAVLYVGLRSVELHLQRIRARVEAGGHDIPEAKVRERYVSSIRNLVELAPRLTELRVLDNSEEGDPLGGGRPRPVLLLHAQAGRVLETCALPACPRWAKPVLAVVLRGAVR